MPILPIYKRSFVVIIPLLSLLLEVNTQASSILQCCSTRYSAAFAVQFRAATMLDTRIAQKTMIAELMNPLSISSKTLLVAFDEDSSSLLGFGQIRPIGKQKDVPVVYHELSSLYVFPEFRKLGVGTALVSELLHRFDKQHGTNQYKAVVCLLTLRPTVPFFERSNFQLVENKKDVPSPLGFEIAAGSILSKILGNELVCMVRK